MVLLEFLLSMKNNSSKEPNVMLVF